MKMWSSGNGDGFDKDRFRKTSCVARLLFLNFFWLLCRTGWNPVFSTATSSECLTQALSGRDRISTDDNDMERIKIDKDDCR